MIITEFYRQREDGINLFKIYSDNNVKIQKVGTEEVYDEAIDVESASYTYTETDIPIDDPTSEIEQKAEAYDYLTGRGEQNE